MNYRPIVTCLLLVFLATSVCLAGEDKVLYSMARKSAKSGQIDFAFLRFNEIARDFPNSRYRKDALFALGEYYYFLPKYDDAAGAFRSFVAEYPNDKGKLFALAYLLKIAEKDDDQKRVKSLQKEIITLKQVSLIFRKYKEFKYQSPLYRLHKAVFRIDKIEVFVGGRPLVQIPL